MPGCISSTGGTRITQVLVSLQSFICHSYHIYLLILQIIILCLIYWLKLSGMRLDQPISCVALVATSDGRHSVSAILHMLYSIRTNLQTSILSLTDSIGRVYAVEVQGSKLLFKTEECTKYSML